MDPEIAKGAIDDPAVVERLVGEGVASWGVLPGIFADLRILHTRSRIAYEHFIQHPMCSKFRFVTPEHGFVIFFKDPNRQQLNLFGPTKDELHRLCAEIYRRKLGHPVPVKARNCEVQVKIPNLARVDGILGEELFSLGQRESAYFSLPAPNELDGCLGLLDAVRIGRTAMTVFYDSKILRFALSEDSF